MNFVNNIFKSFSWLSNNSTEKYVYVTSKDRTPYQEVTGYFIPTLLNYGFRDKAKSFADYLASVQCSNGSWNPPFVFDAAQIIDGLSEFGNRYSTNINLSVPWILSQFCNKRFKDPYKGVISDHIYMRVIYCLSKLGLDIKPVLEEMRSVYFNDDIFRFTALSHFYGYAFEGAARLGLDCKRFISEISSY